MLRGRNELVLERFNLPSELRVGETLLVRDSGKAQPHRLGVVRRSDLQHGPAHSECQCVANV